MTGFSAGMIAAMPQSSALAIQHRSGLRILFFRPLNIVNASGRRQFHAYRFSSWTSPLGRTSTPARRRGISTPCFAAADPKNAPARVRFTVKRHIGYGETHRVVGDHSSLGSWDLGRAVEMAWGEGDAWSGEASIPPGTSFEFKCVQTGSGDASWEGGKNHAVIIPQDAACATVEVVVDWGKGVAVTVQGGNGTSSTPAGDSTGQGEAYVEYSDGEAGSSSSSGNESSFISDDERLPGQAWAGPDTVFMRSNEHSQERQGVWNTEGLEGAALHLVAGDKKAGSWLKKLEVVKSLLVDSAPAMRPERDALTHAFVYLTWISTGALQCVESGGHHRPNHHAQLSRLTFRSLEWIGAERGGTIDALIARRMHTRLPSFTESFTQSTPLTRIRDIAHRNDIPHALKQEIKHTIQNKLHRNAGPEDLVATEALLAKVSATPGEYPEAFLQELRTFLSELRDFFNAGSLSDQLATLQPSLDDAAAQMVDRFNAAKAALDQAGPSADDNIIMDALHGATSIRALLASGLASGLRNDAPDRAMAMRQRWRLAEIRAEDYVFVLLSRFINKLEERGGVAALASGNDGTWALPIGALVICLRHVGLCGYDPQECMAIEHELAAWQRLGGLMHHDEALRLRATLQRALRLADGYCQALLDSLTQPAATLGAALGVEAERAAVFVESEVRSNVVFQLSKLASLLLKATGEVAGITPWDVVVGGNATGVILQVSTLEPGCLDAAGDGDAILLVDSATGDEEIGPLGSRLKGIILKHEVPHLSHLGVRARQEKVPFVTCEDSDLVESVVGPLKGRWATLTAQPDGVSVVAAAGGAGQKAVRASSNGAANGNGTQPAPVIATSDIVRVKKLEFVTLEEAGQESCGAKAASCGRLLHLAAECAAALEVSGRSDGAPIMEALHGVVLPFGCMEAALEADGKTAAFNAAVARAEDAARTACSTTAIAPPEALQQLDAACAELVDLVAGVRIPQAFLQILGGCFDPGSIVIARSSANVEDLQGMSGAGLYESVPNLDPKDPAALQRGIAATWASLFTRRALLARAAAGVPPGSAAMAVVVQRQLAPELSFVLHTVHPVTNDPDTLVAEIAPGLGETLASGTKGSAWRLEVDKPTGNVKTLAFANFSKALLPGGVRSTISKAGTAVAAGAQEGDVSRDDVAAVPVAESEPVSCTVTPRTMDYSTQEMSWSGDMRAALGRRLAAVGVLLENEFGGAQDVEGCVVQGHLCVVQSRPQP